MSMPEFPKPNPDFTQEQALTMILSSIALEEAALSHIMNAEGEKIKYILNQADCCNNSASLKDILAINKSITSLLEMVMQNQMILKSKMETVLEHLPKPPCPPESPCPPKPPCFPEPPCFPNHHCCSSPCPRFHQAGPCFFTVCKRSPVCIRSICTPFCLHKVFALCIVKRIIPF